MNQTGVVSRCVYDEAHLVSTWGRTFRTSYLDCGPLSGMQKVLLSATLTDNVVADVFDILNIDPKRVEWVKGPLDRKNLSFRVLIHPKGERRTKRRKTKGGGTLRLKRIAKVLGQGPETSQENRSEPGGIHGLNAIGDTDSDPDEGDMKDPRIVHLKSLLLQCKKNFGSSGIVYCCSRSLTERVAKGLKLSGISAEAYHSQIAQRVKTDTQRKWLQGKLEVVVATCAFGIGIDKPDVRFVIHYSMPLSIEQYYQEAGRAGRDGKPSACIMLFHRSDLSSVKHFAVYQKNEDLIQASLLGFYHIVNYCVSTLCRREMCLVLLGEKGVRCCDDPSLAKCDACFAVVNDDRSFAVVNPNMEARKLIKALQRAENLRDGCSALGLVDHLNGLANNLVQSIDTKKGKYFKADLDKFHSFGSLKGLVNRRGFTAFALVFLLLARGLLQERPFECDWDSKRRRLLCINYDIASTDKRGFKHIDLGYTMPTSRSEASFSMPYPLNDGNVNQLDSTEQCFFPSESQLKKLLLKESENNKELTDENKIMLPEDMKKALVKPSISERNYFSDSSDDRDCQ